MSGSVGARRGEAERPGVLAQVVRVLHHVELKRLPLKRSIGQPRQERVGEDRRVYLLEAQPQLG
jgi:hypothetical protein